MSFFLSISSSNPDQPSASASCLRSIAAARLRSSLDIPFLGALAPLDSSLSSFCSNDAAVTVITVEASPGRNSAWSNNDIAKSTLGAFKNTTNPSPLSFPSSPEYSFTRGFAVRESNFTTPHFLNVSNNSDSVQSLGKPVTYTAEDFARPRSNAPAFSFSLSSRARFAFAAARASADSRFRASFAAF
ncbi:hypothetical protein BE221DRAFT_45490, partial [Ostreococcus tauri]